LVVEAVWHIGKIVAAAVQWTPVVRRPESEIAKKSPHALGYVGEQLSMGTIAVYVLLAGAISTATGLTLQMIGSAAFAHFKIHDTKELAGLAGLRLSAIFGIAAGLIFSGSHTHYVEAKRDLLEEVRLIGTMYILALNAPDFPNSQGIRVVLEKYAQASAMELEEPQTTDRSADTTNKLLIEICKLTAPDLEKTNAMIWIRTQLETSCSNLIEMRGKKRIWMLTNDVETPFWIFFSISFGFLAFLLGVFEKQPLNLVFAALFYFAAGATAILIYWMGDPYHGPTRIASTPIAQLIAKMHSLDKGQ
jgi:hypothetical protein